MNYRISIIDFINLNNFLKFLEKVKSDGSIVPVRNTNRDESRGSIVPVHNTNRDESLSAVLHPNGPRAAPFVPVRVPTGTSIRPDWLVPVREPGRMAQTNRDYRGFFH